MRKLAGVVVAAAVIAVPAVSALASPAPTKKVNVVDFAFKPKTISVNNGTKVTWAWTAGSGIKHDVSVKSGPVKFHSKKQSKGTFSFTFKKKGTYHLICTIHPTLMKETIVVK
jgi:plastocyanin